MPPEPGMPTQRPAPAMPLDQADGLRRLFAGRRRALLPLVANPHVAFGGVVLDRWPRCWPRRAARCWWWTPPPLAGAARAGAVDLALPASSGCRRGRLPAGARPAAAYVDTRGSAEGLLDALARRAPQADAMLRARRARDLARIFKRRARGPLLLGADHPESIKHAYAGAKLLAQRCG
jgi:hypothetical protein